jgi:DNA-binding NtrC family response regulator
MNTSIQPVPPELTANDVNALLNVVKNLVAARVSEVRARRKLEWELFKYRLKYDTLLTMTLIPVPTGTLAARLREYEKQVISESLLGACGDFETAAATLGISARSLRRKVDDLEIHPLGGVQ